MGFFLNQKRYKTKSEEQGSTFIKTTLKKFFRDRAGSLL